MLHQTFPQIPPFETGFQIVARLAHLVRPKEHLTVSQWAEKHMAHYDPDALPFLAEIMDALSDPATCEVGDMGPAQGGKSTVGEAFMGWSIEHDPAPFMVVQPDKTLMENFVKLRINPLVTNTPALRSQLAPVSNADNMYVKLFRGMYLVSAWPVENQFRQRPICRGWLDDYDGMEPDIEGKGDAIGLLDGRMTTYKGRDTKLVSSSPALGDTKGIEPFIAGGTDERLWPVCPSCGERFEIDMIRDLRFERGDSEQAAQTAHVVCPASGCVLLPDARHQLLASTKTLPNRGFVAARPQAGKYRRTFRRDGLMAFTPWSDLARQWREAEIAWESRQDEAPTRVFYNVKGGKNYRSKLSGEKPVETAEVRKRIEKDWKLGTVPRGPVVVNLTVDVQHDRFEIAAIGTGEGRETWLVDRFPIHVLSDGLTAISPFVHKEHWRVLLPLFDRKYPLAEKGPDGKPVGFAPILSITVDTGGSDKKGDQATEGAKFFWEAARAQGIHPSRITLIKGSSSPVSPLMAPAQFADQKVKGGAKRSSAKLWRPNVHKIKNIIDARLRRVTPGPGYIHLPGDISDEHLDEMTAEELVNGKWKARRPRNETWDLLVYGEAAILRPPFAQSRNDMRWVPPDYRISWPSPAPQPKPAARRKKAKAEEEAVLPPLDEQISTAAPSPPVPRRYGRRENPFLTRRR